MNRDTLRWATVDTHLQYVSFRHEHVKAGEALTLHPKDSIKKIGFDPHHQAFDIIIMRELDGPDPDPDPDPNPDPDPDPDST